MPKVESSSIAAAEHSQYLDIVFRNGAVYRYFNVSGNTYKRFLEAKSKGKFFQKNIRDKYEHERLD